MLRADPDDVPRAPDEPEHDVLVDGDARSVERVLLRHGARPVPSWGRAPHRQYTWWDPSIGRRVRLDLVDEISFGARRELTIEVRDAVLDTAAERDGVVRPDPSSEQWLALFHGLLDRDRLRARDAARLTPWVGDDGDVVAGVLPESVRRDLTEALQVGDWAAVETERGAVRRALRRRQRVRSTGRRIWRAGLARTTKVQRALLRPGPRIALLGPDGAGKSSTIEALIECQVVSSTVYLGVAPTSHRIASPVPGIALARTIARLVTAWLTAAARRRRGHTVALDRHPLEARIGPPTTRRTTQLRRSLLSHVLPRPEAIVVLDAPAEVLQRRKPEHDLDAVADRRARYLALAHREGYPIVDTTAPPAEVVARISHILHERGRAT